MKTLYLIVIACLLSSCMLMKGDVDNPAQLVSGSHPEELKEEASVFDAEVVLVRDEAENIIRKSKNPEVLDSASLIHETTVPMALHVKTLRKEATAKQKLLDEVSFLQKKLSKADNRYQKWHMFVRFLGVLAIPLGLALAWKISGEFIILSLFGAGYLVTSYVVDFLEKNSTWVAVSILAVVVYVVVRVFILQRRSLFKVTEVGMKLRERVASELGGDEPSLHEAEAPAGVKLDRSSRKQIKNIAKQVERKVAKQTART